MNHTIFSLESAEKYYKTLGNHETEEGFCQRHTTQQNIARDITLQQIELIKALTQHSGYDCQDILRNFYQFLKTEFRVDIEPDRPLVSTFCVSPMPDFRKVRFDFLPHSDQGVPHPTAVLLESNCTKARLSIGILPKHAQLQNRFDDCLEGSYPSRFMIQRFTIDTIYTEPIICTLEAAASQLSMNTHSQFPAVARPYKLLYQNYCGDEWGQYFGNEASKIYTPATIDLQPSALPA